MKLGRAALALAATLMMTLALIAGARAEATPAKSPAVAPGTVTPAALVFLQAATSGDTATVQNMLADTPALATLKFKKDVTALHAAALSDEPRTVELLLKRGAFVDARGGEQAVTPLFLAVMKGHRRVAEALLNRRADPNSKGRVPSDEGFDELRPLHLAAVGGYTDLADVLVQRGAVLSTPSSSGSTALDYAWRTNNIPIALMLGAYRDMGLVRGRPVAALLRAIAAQDSAATSAVLDRERSIVNTVLEHRWTPLHLAAWLGSRSVCDALIARGANLNAVEATTHWTPALRAYDTGHTELCEYLRRRDSASHPKGPR